ncbi:MAG: type II secretion system protein [Phycisphaerae bacterium]|nr:type II secretion system protein [Phycisphaerae bacterium]
MATPRRAAFTLLELLVSVAVMAALSALTCMAVGSARERARAIKVHAELYGLGVALEAYGIDCGGCFPPVRVNCNSDMQDHWCQLPMELADGRYIPPGPGGGLSATLVDEFNPGHTYKYAAPGPMLLNGTPAGNYQVWIPDDVPLCESAQGRYYYNPQTTPVRWMVWSTGPHPKSEKSCHERAPMAAASWYRGAGDEGVLVRFRDAQTCQFKSP